MYILCIITLLTQALAGCQAAGGADSVSWALASSFSSPFRLLAFPDPEGSGWADFLSPPVLTPCYDCHTDPAKSTPHYPNETLARDASSLALHRPPIKSLLCCSMPGKTLRGGPQLILNKMEVGGVQCARRFSFF